MKNHKELINKFFDKHQIHEGRKDIALSKGKKSTYKVRVLYDNEPTKEVNFWINDTSISYGIVNFGIMASDNIKNL